MTIVVEEKFLEADYLADYGEFNGTVFSPFDRYCKRLHFFTQHFDREQFKACLLSQGEERKAAIAEFNASYLGFTVIRPLPDAYIGRTVVKVNVNDPEWDRYKAVMNTRIHLFGIPLTVCASLPFQQQDNVVAACSTVALWSAFFKTADLFGTPRPRPGEITRNATENVLNEARSFPARALSADQICAAIRANGLDFEVFDVARGSIPTMSLIRAYLEMGLPVMLMVARPKEAYHTVTAVGYELTPAPIRLKETNQRQEAPSVGRCIRALFCHDDNVGPFTRYEVLRPPARRSYVRGGKWPSAIRFHVCRYNEVEPMRLHQVIVPVHPTIRLRFEDLQKWVNFVDFAFAASFGRKGEDSKDYLDAFDLREWDVSLVSNDAARKKLSSLDRLSEAARLALLTKGQPRYLWQAIMRIHGRDIVLFYVDATSFSRPVQLWRTIFMDRRRRLGATEALAERATLGDDWKALSRFLDAEAQLDLGEPD